MGTHVNEELPLTAQREMSIRENARELSGLLTTDGLEIRVGFEPSAGTRQVDQHFCVFGTVLASSSLESDDQAAVGA